MQAALNGQISQMQAALHAYAGLPQDWRNASTASDYTIPMTAEAVAALVEKIEHLLQEVMAVAPPLGAPRPAGMWPFDIILNAAPPYAIEPDA